MIECTCYGRIVDRQLADGDLIADIVVEQCPRCAAVPRMVDLLHRAESNMVWCQLRKKLQELLRELQVIE